MSREHRPGNGGSITRDRKRFYHSLLEKKEDAKANREILEALVEDFLQHGEYHGANETRWGPVSWVMCNPFKAIAVLIVINMWFVSDLREPILHIIARLLLGGIGGG